MSKVIQKSEVCNLRCINVCQYCKYYLKYRSREGVHLQTGAFSYWGAFSYSGALLVIQGALLVI